MTHSTCRRGEMRRKELPLSTHAKSVKTVNTKAAQHRINVQIAMIFWTLGGSFRNTFFLKSKHAKIKTRMVPKSIMGCC